MLVRFKFLFISLTFIFSFILHVSCRNVVREKRQSSSPQTKRIVCYYAFWGALRPKQFRFLPSDINPELCTHIMYVYARLEPGEGIVPNNVKLDIEDEGWKSMVNLKSINPTAKILLSVGGRFEGSSRFTRIAADIQERRIFAQSAATFLRNFGFDGIDIAWLYAGFSEGSSSADKENFVSLMKVVREELTDDHILSISVPSLKQYIDKGINVSELLKYADYMNVLAYDYHDSTDATVNHHGPLYSLPDDPGNKDANVDTTIREYLKRGARPDQLNLIIPLYAVAFSLENPDENDIGAPTEDEGFGVDEPGAISYFELCQKMKKEKWTVKKVNSTAMGPYAYINKIWVAYDDEEMVRNKARYADEKRLGGIGFWTVDQDDFKGLCGLNNFPLLKAGREAFLMSGSFVPTSVAEVPDFRERPVSLAGNAVTKDVTKPTVQTFTTKPVEVEQPPRTPKTSFTNSSPKPPISRMEPKPTIKRPFPPTKPDYITPDEEVLVLKPDIPQRKTIYSSRRDIIFSVIRFYVENNYHNLIGKV